MVVQAPAGVLHRRRFVTDEKAHSRRPPRGALRPPPATPQPSWPPPHWPPRADDRGLRLDIEGLRAVAVLLVLCFHAELGPFTGGYIGVDAFFVVSGFLITSLLLGELQRTGSIRLGRFWSRRARRLPASSLVIVTTLLAGIAVLDPLSLTDFADGLAAATFTINIVLAWRQNDYLAADPPSPLLHFWSLALEEQFYLVWPLLCNWSSATGTTDVPPLPRSSSWRGRSLSQLPLVLTPQNQPWAFFSLWTRAWELLALAPSSCTRSGCRR